MKKKLKIALIRRNSEQGFALPIAVGLGFVMILVAATMVMRSQGDQVTASAQKATASSLGTAETGITRVQSLLNTYGFLANTTLIGNSPTTSTWKQTYEAAPSPPAGCSNAAAGLTHVSGYILNNWIDLDSGGQFKIIEYTYSPNSAQITSNATIPATGSVDLNISPADYLADGGSIYGEIQSVPGILFRNSNTYTFKRLSTGSNPVSITSTDNFAPKNTSLSINAGITIPASGAVDITPNILSSNLNYLAVGGSLYGRINGIQGILSHSGATYTFKRLYSGIATTTTATVNFIPTTTPGTGTLKIEGRVNQVDANADGDDLDDSDTSINTATSRLVVKIPVVSANSSAVGLWLQNVPQNMGSNLVNGNIWVTGCSLPTGVSNSNVTTGYAATPNPNIPFPDTPDLPDSSKLNPTVDTDIWGNTLPRTDGSGNITDVQNDDGSYHYLIQGNLSKNGGANISLMSGKKVVFYVQGNIEIGGGPEINRNGYPQNMQIYGNTFKRNADGTIKRNVLNQPETKYGCPTSITLPTINAGLTDPPTAYTVACPTLKLETNGNASINALIHAPDATGNVAGGGGGCTSSGNPPSGGGFIGAVWIKKWDRQSNNPGPMVCEYGNYSNYLSTQQIMQPSIPGISSWEREAN